MATTARRMLGDARWWHVPLGALGAGVLVFVVALLFGVDRGEAAWHGTNGAMFGVSFLLLGTLPPNTRTAAAMLIPVWLLNATARWLFGSGIGSALGHAFLTTMVIFGLGAARRRAPGDDATRPRGIPPEPSPR